MTLRRSIQRLQNEPKIRPKRTALIRYRPPNCAKTVRGLVLATPDELEDENLRVRKLKSSVITLESFEPCLASAMNDFLDFAPCGDDAPPRPIPTLTNPTKKVNHNENADKY